MSRRPSEPDLAEKLERIGAEFSANKESAVASEANGLGLFLAALNIALTHVIEALAAAHREQSRNPGEWPRDRATLDDYQAQTAQTAQRQCRTDLAPICAELGLSPGEDMGAVVAAIRAQREQAAAILRRIECWDQARGLERQA